MRSSKGTGYVKGGLILAVLALLGLEAATLADKHEDNTISQIVASSASRHPILAFMVGVLIGHWWWPLERR